jgi:hypothetical protein
VETADYNVNISDKWLKKAVYMSMIQWGSTQNRIISHEHKVHFDENYKIIIKQD